MERKSMQRKKCGDGASAGGGNNSGRLSLGRLPVEVSAVLVSAIQDGHRVVLWNPTYPTYPTYPT